MPTHHEPALNGASLLSSKAPFPRSRGSSDADASAGRHREADGINTMEDRLKLISIKAESFDAMIARVGQVDTEDEDENENENEGETSKKSSAQGAAGLVSSVPAKSVVEVEELRDGFLRVVTKMEGASMRYREIKQQLNLQIHESAATRASGGADGVIDAWNSLLAFLKRHCREKMLSSPFIMP